MSLRLPARQHMREEDVRPGLDLSVNSKVHGSLVGLFGVGLLLEERGELHGYQASPCPVRGVCDVW